MYVHSLVEESNNLSGNVLASSLLVVHDTGRGGKNNVTELTRWEKLDDPLLEICEADVVSGGDDTGLVETDRRVRESIKQKDRTKVLPAVQLDDNLARSVVINFLKFTNVSWRMSVCCERLNV